jgi:uncharacterized protein YbjQ (UPF0145 family)
MKQPDANTQASRAASEAKQADILQAIQQGTMPSCIGERLTASREGTAPWIATMTPAELLIARSHGLRPIAAVSATCWMYYGYSWTEGHAQGWQTALERLRDEARVAGANAVVDVKMRTIPIGMEASMDFSLIGTAVKVDGLPPSKDPVIATVPALEFVKLLDADIVPTGIAVGAQYEWISDWRGSVNNLFWVGNTETQVLSGLWERVRREAHAELRRSAQKQGNGALAHINFSQMFEREQGENQPKQYLARHIVIATTVDTPNVVRRAIDGPRHIDLSLTTPRLEQTQGAESSLDFQMVVDLHEGKTPLKRTIQHHQAYALNTQEGAI